VKTEDAQNLCWDLTQADSEEEVIQILKKHAFWDDPSVWRFYGDRARNWATVGGQQSKPDHALGACPGNRVFLGGARRTSLIQGVHAQDLPPLAG
jgi:hypothetical protein